MDRYQIVAPVFETYAGGVRIEVGYTYNFFDMAVHTTDFNQSYQELVYGVTLCKKMLFDVSMLHAYLGYPLDNRTCTKPVLDGLYLVFYDNSKDRYELLRVIEPNGIVEPTLIKSAARYRRY